MLTAAKLSEKPYPVILTGTNTRKVPSFPENWITEVIILNAAAIVVVIFGLLFVIGGPILGSLAVKASERAEKEEANTNRK